MTTVALATLSFAVLKAVPALLFSFWLGFSSGRGSLDDFLLVSYLMVLSTGLMTAGFVIPTAASPSWRGLTVTRAVVIAGVLGFLAPVFALFFAFVTAAPLLPLFRSAAWLAIPLYHGLPGVALGLVALGIARVSPGPSKTA